VKTLSVGVPVYRQSDAYRLGWVFGFYACRNDEGSRYGHVEMKSESRRWGPRDRADFQRGCDDGFAIRHGGGTRLDVGGPKAA